MNESKSKLKDYILLITYAVLLFLAVSNIGVVLTFLGKVISVMMPFLIGILFAVILNIPMSFLERKLFYRLEKIKRPFAAKLKRPLSLLTTMILFFVFISAVAMFVIPQLSDSISTLTWNMNGYLRSLESFLESLSDRFSFLGAFGEDMILNWNEIAAKAGQIISTALPHILTFTMGLTNGIINMVMGLIVAVYLLADKEKIIRHCKKLIAAFTPEKTASWLIETGAQVNRTFNSFISGQLTEAMILGALVFIGMLIFRFPYALLCAVIIALTSLIPVFGAWIGAIPSAFIILMAQPSKTLWFILFIIVLQQIEGNFIYPKVVGNSIGLDGLWVLFAIIVGGSLFGIAGLLLGVPACAVLFTIIRKTANRRLDEKKVEIR